MQLLSLKKLNLLLPNLYENKYSQNVIHLVDNFIFKILWSSFGICKCSCQMSTEVSRNPTVPRRWRQKSPVKHEDHDNIFHHWEIQITYKNLCFWIAYLFLYVWLSIILLQYTSIKKAYVYNYSSLKLLHKTNPNTLFGKRYLWILVCDSQSQ
jgi:hypothetical protein